MSSQAKLSGIDTTGNLLKIPKTANYPYVLKPNFEKKIDDIELKDFIQNRLKLRIFQLTADSTEVAIPGMLKPMKAGADLVFMLNTADLDEATLYICRIVQSTSTITDSNFADADIVIEFSFQVVSAESVEFSQVSALSKLEQLPDGLKDVRVGLKRTERADTEDKKFWEFIKSSSRAISFDAYEEFMNGICGLGESTAIKNHQTAFNKLTNKRFLPFTDTDSYRTIKVLTEFFLLINCTSLDDLGGYTESIEYEDYNGANPGKKRFETLPFYKTIRDRLPDLRIKIKSIGDILDLFAAPAAGGTITDIDRVIPRDADCFGLLKDSLNKPCFIELIWSYWHEEAMLVQALNAISLRFQNVRATGSQKDPLANLEVGPLRPLNNLIWGYIQDEQHRLSVKRRAYEYDHHYGITLQGKAVPTIQGADSRTRFLEAFHLLLYQANLFFRDDDDLTKVADGYSLLNALKEVHFILSEGMHNQYGDLPFTARVEMLSQQWLLARPELREFLPSRSMIAYPESWMGPLSTMNTLQGWTNQSPVHFNTLAVYGEMLLLSIRFGNWNDLTLTSDNAANWARAFRPEIQGYLHSYRGVTGVDLSMPHPQTGKIDAQQPALHLLRRAKAGSNGNGHVNASANGKSTVGY